MASSVSLEISEQWFHKVDAQLQAMGNIGESKLIRRGVEDSLKAGNRRVYQVLPRPGYPGDKPGFVALRDTLEVVVKAYGRGEHSSGMLVGVAGYRWLGGQHGHIVEHGHRIARGGTLSRTSGGSTPISRVTGGRGQGSVAGFVEGRKWLEKGFEQTRQERGEILENAINRAIYEASPGTE